jgi:hypothetical protein
VANVVSAGFMTSPISRQKYYPEKVGALIWIFSQDFAESGREDLKVAVNSQL